jgi:phage shock protein PspC (stress-responsive transcriptional regulator)
MTETTDTLTGGEAAPRRLYRAADRRWLGGVCAGLGRYFGLSPMIYRVAFAALALAGGTGVLLYLAAWLVIPDEGAEDSIAAQAIEQHRTRPWLLIGVSLLALGVILTLSEAHVWPGPGSIWLAAAIAGGAIVWWQLGTRPAGGPLSRDVGPEEVARARRGSLLPVAVGLLIGGLGVVALVDAATSATVDWRIALAAAAVVLGGLVAAGAATGRAVGSVAVLGVIVLAACAIAFAVRVPVFAGFGDRTIAPASAAGLHARYEHGIGNFVVDLQDVSLPVGETRVKATLGIGDLEVRVPEDVTVRVDGRASAGQVVLFGHSDDGSAVHERTVSVGSAPRRVLVLDARVGLGELEVHRG